MQSNGMDVFSKSFRRLVSSNASRIFPGSNIKGSENAASYPLLIEQIQKVLVVPSQAKAIADSVDEGDGDVFRDFDLITFVKHFRLDPVAETVLCNGFRKVSRAELRIKGL